MQDLVSFLGKYDTNYPKVVKGYARAEIRRLEDVLERSLPAVYDDFLSSVGENLGFLMEDLTFSIDELVELAAYKKPTTPANFTPIAVDLSPSYADYFMVREHPEHDDGLIVRAAAGSMKFDDLLREFPSFRDMIFFWGFQRVRMLTLPHRVNLRWDLEDFQDSTQPPTLLELGQIVERLGFASANVTGPTMPLYERGDCAGSIFRAVDAPTFAIYLAGESREVVETVGEVIRDQMPGNAQRWT